jgi:hypothetical protein
MKLFWPTLTLVEYYIDSLKNDICVVEFTKQNGETRRMRCTLMDKYLPKENRKDEETKVHMRKGLTVIVWDLDSNGWRSFYPSSITSFNVESTLQQGVLALT